MKIALALISLVLVGCGQTPQHQSIQETFSPSAAPPHQASPSIPSPSQTVATTFQCSPAGTNGGTAGATTTVTGVAVGAHTGYDRMAITFTGPMPEYTVTPQSNSVFTQPTSGQPATLQGTGGVAINMKGIDNWTTYSAPTHFTPDFPFLREASLVENFEAIQTWGLGIAGTPCMSISELSSPTRLVVDVAS